MVRKSTIISIGLIYFYQAFNNSNSSRHYYMNSQGPPENPHKRVGHLSTQNFNFLNLKSTHPMKKGKLILAAITLATITVSAFSFNAYSGKRSTSNIYRNNTCTQKIQCQTADAGIGPCQVSLTLYVITTGGSCVLWTGSKYASPNL